MKIPVLNYCPNLVDSIGIFLDFSKKFMSDGKSDIYFKNYKSFENVEEGIIFVGLQEDTLEYPISVKNQKKNILYVYIVNGITSIENNELIMTEERPKYSIIIPKFKQMIDVMIATDSLEKALKSYRNQIVEENISTLIDNWHDKNHNVISEFIKMQNDNLKSLDPQKNEILGGSSIDEWYDKKYNPVSVFVRTKKENSVIPAAPNKPNFKPNEFKSPEDNDLPMVRRVGGSK